MSYLCNRKSGASVAEQVDALDSKSSGVKPVPVRFRPDVRNERGKFAYPFFLLSFSNLHLPKPNKNMSNRLCYFGIFSIFIGQNVFAILQKSKLHSSIFRNEKAIKKHYSGQKKRQMFDIFAPGGVTFPTLQSLLSVLFRVIFDNLLFPTRFQSLKERKSTSKSLSFVGNQITTAW